MAKRRSASPRQSAAWATPRAHGFAAKPRGWPVAAMGATALLLAYVFAARYLFGPAQPLLWQRILGAGCALLAVPPFLLFARYRSLAKLDLLRAQMSRQSDFSKQLLASHAHHRRSVKLPLIGETSLRSLGGIAVFAVTFAWWWTPLAPVRVQERTVDDLTVPFGEEIVAVALVVPNGRIAIVVPPQLPPRAEQLGRLIKDNADTYQRGLKAIAAHRYEDARVLLDAAAREGRADPLQVQLAQAQTDMYAGLFAKAAAAFEKVVSQKPDNVMYLLQGAAAWLQAGVAENAEPLVARAMKACSEKPAPNDPDKDRELAYSLHVQAVMQAVHGKQFVDAAATCTRARDLLKVEEVEQPAEKDSSFLAASWNDEAVLCLLAGKYPGAVNRFETARYTWMNAVGSRHPSVAVAADNQAVLYVILDKYREADEALSRAESVVGGLIPREQPLVAYTAVCRALLQAALGQPDVALAPTRDASAIIEKALGPAHPADVAVLDVLTLLYAGQGKYYKAEACCHKTLDLSRRIWGPQHPFFAQALSRHAELSILDEHYSEAEASCRQALEIFQQSLGKEHPDVATVLNAWGWLEIERGRPADARPYLEAALKIRQDTFGQEHLDVADTLGHLAALENAPESYRRGEDRYKRALDINVKLLGADHPNVARLLRAEALLLLEEKQFPEASTCLDRALTIQEKTLRPSHPDLAATLESYVSVLRATTPPDLPRANDMEARAKMVREKQSEEDRPEF